ncbi:MAG TPA: hypothetical protein DD381_08160 [Lentisphaeria bacterium]|nr:MAG: hypothetical protein A2X47_04725 [Lentisphaerae bacterium GWF2_38_69]HBM16296.1 hypothetical protein [Lentisphaeria bacterium]
MKISSFSLRCIFEYFFPAICPNCRKEIIDSGDCLCKKCSAEVVMMTSSALCSCCGARLDTVLDLCSKCISEEKHSWDSAICILEMNNIIHDMILNFKYKNKIELYPFFAKTVSERIIHDNLKFDFITSIPLHPLKFFMRGYNQSSLVAKRVAKLLQIPYKRLLLRRRYTKTQTSLSAEKRRKNLKNVFLPKNRAIIEGKDILLIDDIFTTGSTLRSAAKELADSGANKVTILVLARR